MEFGIIAYDGCTASMITGISDILTLANNLHGDPIFHIHLVSASDGPITSFSRFPIACDRSIQSRSGYDLLYIPGFVGELEPILSANSALIRWLVRQATEHHTILAAACNGNFILAETGLLKERKATTHWSQSQSFRQRYPSTDLQPEMIVIDQGDIISAAGVTSYLNLALHLIQRFMSAEVSLQCAKIFLVDSGRRVQTPYQMYQPPRNHGDTEIDKVQEWLEKNFHQPVTLDALMPIAHLGKKTLLRRFRKATGETPLAYLQKMRIENAKRLLESQNLSFTEVTWQVGYSDASSFHKAFKTETGLTPIEYRRRFSIV